LQGQKINHSDCITERNTSTYAGTHPSLRFFGVILPTLFFSTPLTKQACHDGIVLIRYFQAISDSTVIQLVINNMLCVSELLGVWSIWRLYEPADQARVATEVKY